MDAASPGARRALPALGIHARGHRGQAAIFGAAAVALLASIPLLRGLGPPASSA